MLIISIVGGIGSGKSYVTNMFKKRNVPIINSDHIAKQVLLNDKVIVSQIKNYFHIGNLNKKTFKQLKIEIFQNNKSRLFLENLIHPTVVKLINEHVGLISHVNQIKCEKAGSYCIIEVPLVFNLINILAQIKVDKVILTTCAEDLQISRIMHRDHLSKRQALSIIKYQLPIKKLFKLTNNLDYVIDTNMSADVNQQVNALHKEFTL